MLSSVSLLRNKPIGIGLTVGDHLVFFNRGFGFSMAGVLPHSNSLAYAVNVEFVLLNQYPAHPQKCDEHSTTKDEENAPRDQICVSQCNGPSTEQHESMFEMLCAASTKQHDSLAFLHDPTNSVAQQTTFNANEVLEGSHGEKSQTASAGHAKAEEKSVDVQAESLSVKSGLENEYNCKELVSMPPSPPPVAQSFVESDMICTNMHDGISPSYPVCASILGAYASEEADKLHKDQCSDSRNDLSQKRKLISVLITYKRNKRTKSITMLDIGKGCAAKNCASDTPPGADCSVDLENKKARLSKSFTRNEEKTLEPQEESRVQAPATEVVLQIEDSLHLSVGTSTDVLVEISQFSCDMSLRKGKVHIDDDGNDINPGSTPGSASKKQDSVTPLDLSLTPHASHDIDCNRLLDEDFLTGPSEIHPDSVGLSSNGGENTPKENTSLLRAVINKGKFVVDKPPAGTLSKHNHLQLFPENANAQALQLANHLEMAGQHRPSSSLFHSVSVKPEVMTTSHLPAYPATPELPHHGQSFHDFVLPTSNRAQSFPRHQMLLDNILTPARAARGGKFVQQTTWSEEELDCLWIGVRRHGRGNWDVILGDRRLHFSPWKTCRDLAEKWQEEQSQLFSGASLPQPRPPQEMYTSTGILAERAFCWNPSETI